MPASSNKTERPEFNPDMFRWARELRGISIEEVAAKFKKTPSQIRDWETDAIGPTVKQARALAEFYGRSFLEFFRQEPPRLQRSTLVPDFRMQRGVIDRSEDSGLLDIQSWAEAQRANALDLYDELGERPPSIPPTAFCSTDIDTEYAAATAREVIGFDFNEQLQIKPSDAGKLPDLIRSRLERIGILTFKRSDIAKVRSRGMCIAVFPLPVIIFGNEAPGAQAFTLIHEFAHVLIKESGIVGQSHKGKSGRRNIVENWCNQFSASFLMPQDNVIAKMGKWPAARAESISDNDLIEIAKAFRVSPHAMLIRLVHLGYVNSRYYWEIKKPIFEKEEENYKAFGRPSYYGSRYKSTLGNLYTGLVLEAWSAGRITNHNAAEYMGIKNFKHLTDIRDHFGAR